MGRVNRWLTGIPRKPSGQWRNPWTVTGSAPPERRCRAPSTQLRESRPVPSLDSDAHQQLIIQHEVVWHAGSRRQLHPAAATPLYRRHPVAHFDVLRSAWTPVSPTARQMNSHSIVARGLRLLQGGRAISEAVLHQDDRIRGAGPDVGSSRHRLLWVLLLLCDRLSCDLLSRSIQHTSPTLVGRICLSRPARTGRFPPQIANLAEGSGTGS